MFNQLMHSQVLRSNKAVDWGGKGKAYSAAWNAANVPFA